MGHCRTHAWRTLLEGAGQKAAQWREKTPFEYFFLDQKVEPLNESRHGQDKMAAPLLAKSTTDIFADYHFSQSPR